MNGSTTADVMSDPATVDCNFDVGLAACAEKCRIADWLIMLAAAVVAVIFVVVKQGD